MSNATNVVPLHTEVEQPALQEADTLKALVLSVIQGEQDYRQLLTFLEPVIQGAQNLQNDTALPWPCCWKKWNNRRR